MAHKLAKLDVTSTRLVTSGFVTIINTLSALGTEQAQMKVYVLST